MTRFEYESLSDAELVALAATKVSEVLDRAADEIGRRGWCRGHFVIKDGSICALQAINIFGWNIGAYTAFRNYVGMAVTQFNDKHARSKEEVIAALRACAEKHRETTK